MLATLRSTYVTVIITSDKCNSWKEFIDPFYFWRMYERNKHIGVQPAVVYSSDSVHRAQQVSEVIFAVLILHWSPRGKFISTDKMVAHAWYTAETAYINLGGINDICMY